ncbi:ABC transporter six-transmembrane domain-containing protein [Aquisalinus flavus]|uniref:Membrane protein n=1 Tax=Aquisalinus flavus TaxID=1526572 RepID=A0A8J2V3W7_9PROT|nr:ABC transporter six-transmembrane domain-containing protein [Aquisalinus flavus]MBD0425364.1 hypothetical protein [Aquisalinus flavus]UNE48986.1 hypothetical protein FF099_13480 [Aquisalinus flavus]GGD16663.1 membrane protein [Aquisalinus flavus]
MSDRSATPEGLSHAGIVKRYRWAIAGTLALLALENLFTVIEPWLLGRAIDSLIGDSFLGIVIYLAAAIIALALGVSRRLYDTRIYGRIYRESAGDVVERQIANAKPTAQTAAHVSFVQEFVDFFEHMLPAAIVSIFMLLGSVVMMAIISPLLCLGTIVVAGLISAIFGLSARRINSLNTGLNDEAERQVDILEARDILAVRSHFFSLVRWRIQLSDLEARNFGGVFLLTFILTAFAVWVLVSAGDKSTGEIFAALSYVLQFSQSVIILPYTYQQFLRTSEIGTRLSRASPDAS